MVSLRILTSPCKSISDGMAKSLFPAFMAGEQAFRRKSFSSVFINSGAILNKLPSKHASSPPSVPQSLNGIMQ